MEELWKPAPGLDGFYEISNVGNFRRSAGGQNAQVGTLKRLYPDKNGYLTRVAYLGKKGRIKCVKMHRLVVQAFIGPIPKGLVVNHKNGNKADNRVENLEIVSISENTAHGFRVLGRKPNCTPQKGVDHHHARYTEDDIRAIRSLYESGITQVQIAAMYKTRQSAISKIVRREAWPHVN